MTENGFKICKRCKLALPVENFHPDKKSRDRLQYQCKSCKKELAREDRASSFGLLRFRIAQKRFAQSDTWRSEENKKKRRECRLRQIEKNPLKMKARSAVSNATRLGKIPRARDLLCVKCGEAASQYHHHNGYEQEHWLDVVPVCRPCHLSSDGIKVLPNQVALYNDKKPLPAQQAATAAGRLRRIRNGEDPVDVYETRQPPERVRGEWFEWKMLALAEEYIDEDCDAIVEAYLGGHLTDKTGEMDE